MHTPDQIKVTVEDRDRIEDLVGMGHGAWDMVPIEDIVNGVVGWYFEKQYEEAEPEPLSDEQIDNIVQRVTSPSPDLTGELVAAAERLIRQVEMTDDFKESAHSSLRHATNSLRAVLAKVPETTNPKG